MDIRTGIIPFSEVITKDRLVKKEDTDFDNDILRKRAETAAIRLTLEEIGMRLNDFLTKE